MKKLCALMSALATVVVLSASSYAANIPIPIKETSIGGGAETLSVGFAGATIGGTTDNWTITVPGLMTDHSPTVWVEAPGDIGFNELSTPALGGDVLDLISEASVVIDPATNTCGTGSALALGVSCLVGTDAAGNQYFASISEVRTAVPEPASLALLGGALLGFGFYWRRRRAI